jgi:hypothetical protein
LYLPMLPERDSEDWRELTQGLGLAGEHLLAFTSPDALSGVVGRYAREYRAGDFATLARFWPDPGTMLALNPGLPIRAILPLHALAELAQGSESLVTVDDLQAAITDEVHTQLRQGCLTELGNGEPPLGAEPENELEVLLSEAAGRQDADAFLDALLDAEVVVPTTAPEPGPIGESGFPWRHITVGDVRVITMFSSPGMLDRVASAEQHRVRVPFLSALAGWPGEEHMLCFNPGGQTELILSGEAVAELFSVVAESSLDIAES